VQFHRTLSGQPLWAARQLRPADFTCDPGVDSQVPRGGGAGRKRDCRLGRRIALARVSSRARRGRRIAARRRALRSVRSGEHRRGLRDHHQAIDRAGGADLRLPGRDPLGHEQAQRAAAAQARDRPGQAAVRIRGADPLRRGAQGNHSLVSGEQVKRALITGITGQDGSYLAELLLEKGYEVHGVIRRASTFNTSRIDHLYADPHINGVRMFLHYGDLSDSVNLVKLLYELKPDEIYHLAAQTHVRVSFDIPEYTADVTGVGTIRILEAIRESGSRSRFFQASSSEVFGKA